MHGVWTYLAIAIRTSIRADLRFLLKYLMAREGVQDTSVGYLESPSTDRITLAVKRVSPLFKYR
jgi:hypothetical protein